MNRRIASKKRAGLAWTHELPPNVTDTVFRCLFTSLDELVPLITRCETMLHDEIRRGGDVLTPMYDDARTVLKELSTWRMRLRTLSTKTSDDTVPLHRLVLLQHVRKKILAGIRAIIPDVMAAYSTLMMAHHEVVAEYYEPMYPYRVLPDDMEDMDDLDEPPSDDDICFYNTFLDNLRCIDNLGKTVYHMNRSK